MANRVSEARLMISEPWDQSGSIFGTLEEEILSDIPRLLFTGENNRKYLISLRYKESQINDIWSGNHVIVYIEELKPDSADSSSSGLNTLFEGIGGIEIVKT